MRESVNSDIFYYVFYFACIAINLCDIIAFDKMILEGLLMKKLCLLALKDFLLAICAGLSISIGCVAFLASGNKIVGALFFVIGLFMVCNFNFNLFTGKVCYAFDNKPIYLGKLAIIWLGNFAGACVAALAVGATRLDGLLASAQTIVQTKMDDSLLSLFVLGIFCNILIYLAVHGYKNFDNAIAKTLALVFGVSVFVLCGFEHCVADMFYFVFAGAWSWSMVLRLLIITLGNIVGGLLFPAIFKLTGYLDKKQL